MKMLVAVVVALIVAAECSCGAQSTPSPPSRRQELVFQPPVNLTVLPKQLTGRQVHNIMEQWSGDLGVRCNACHEHESDGIVPGGRAHSRFADDSKPMKRIARLMYTMTQQINRTFITGDDRVPGPVTCGTCHRGNIRPVPFVSRPHDEYSEGDRMPNLETPAAPR
jgi:hypothetical protein